MNLLNSLNSFSTFFPLLNGARGTAFAIVGVIFAAVGAYCFLSAFMPQVLATYRTKNTVGISKKMFMLHFTVGVLFFYGAVLLALNGIIVGKSLWHLTAIGGIFSFLNFTAAMGCLYIVLLKAQNQQEAEKMNITELEHYNQVCVPYCQERILKRGGMESNLADEPLEV